MVILTPGAVASLQRMGDRAGRHFLDTGIWPRNPFDNDRLEPLARVWRAAVFAVVGPALRPH